MASQLPIADSADPLSGLHGPMLFPRTIRASADVPVPADGKDLESVHNFMKSLELRSPEKLMNEAKRIVDGGATHLESNLAKFTKNVSISDGVVAKVNGKPQERRPDGGAKHLESDLAKFTKTVGISDGVVAKVNGKLQERRPGLGLARKRVPFSLRTNNSQPTANLQPTLDIEILEDPDEFFNAYERMEKAKKEIAKQLGANMDNLKRKPLNHARVRREGILGRTYNYKHRYSSLPSENDMFKLSPQKVDQDVTLAPNDEPQEKLVHSDPTLDTELEEVQVAASIKKVENEVSGILEELLSFNSEDLEGDGAFNLLQKRLNIKPLDLENLYRSELPVVRRTSTFTVTERELGSTSIFTTTERLQKHNKTPLGIGSVLNPLNPTSPTPPRSPFASISSLQKRLLQPFPLRDPFLPTDADVSASQNASSARPKNQLLDQVELVNDLGLSNELESCLEVDTREMVVSNTDAQENMGNADNLPEQFVDENASTKSRNVDCTPNEEIGNIETTMSMDEEMGNADNLPEQLVDENACTKSRSVDCTPNGELGNIDTTMSMDEEMGNADNLPEQFVDENANTKSRNVDCTPNEEIGNIDTTMSMNEEMGNADNLSELFVDENASTKSRTVDCTPNGELGNIDTTISMDEEMGNADNLPEQFVDENASTKSRNVECTPNEELGNIEKTMSMDENNSSPVIENEVRDDAPSRQQNDTEQPEVHKSKPPKGGKVIGRERIKKAHPMRKSLAAAGTSFESGVRRSKRIKMRPLEYWKGERFLFGRVDDSVKLIGVKYISPGKDNEKLKVKAYIESDSSEYKEILELAARH